MTITALTMSRDGATLLVAHVGIEVLFGGDPRDGDRSTIVWYHESSGQLAESHNNAGVLVGPNATGFVDGHGNPVPSNLLPASVDTDSLVLGIGQWLLAYWKYNEGFNSLTTTGQKFYALDGTALSPDPTNPVDVALPAGLTFRAGVDGTYGVYHGATHLQSCEPTVFVEVDAQNNNNVIVISAGVKKTYDSSFNLLSSANLFPFTAFGGGVQDASGNSYINEQSETVTFPPWHDQYLTKYNKAGAQQWTVNLTSLVGDQGHVMPKGVVRTETLVAVGYSEVPFSNQATVSRILVFNQSDGSHVQSITWGTGSNPSYPPFGDTVNWPAGVVASASTPNY